MKGLVLIGSIFTALVGLGFGTLGVLALGSSLRNGAPERRSDTALGIVALVLGPSRC